MAGTLAERVVLELFRRFPPRETIFKDPGPRPRAEYEDERAFSFSRFFGEDGATWLRGRDVLDLGCGYGGRTVRFAELGARSVAGVEIASELVEHARVFASASGVDADFREGAGEALPFADGSFDLILMNDVMEHVVAPAAVLAECRRVLRPGGRVALVFPPYYDFSGGSHLHGYATRLPALNLLFPTRTLKAAALRRFGELGIDHRPFLREVPSDKLWNQNGLTVRGFDAAVGASGFEVEQRRLIGHRDHRLADHRGAALAARSPMYAIAEAAANLPLLREVFCSRIAAVLRRPA